jgi:Cyclin M transmembrane N-terminal domain
LTSLVDASLWVAGLTSAEGLSFLLVVLGLGTGLSATSATRAAAALPSGDSAGAVRTARRAALTAVAFGAFPCPLLRIGTATAFVRQTCSGSSALNGHRSSASISLSQATRSLRRLPRSLAGFLASAAAAVSLAEPLVTPLGFLGSAAEPVAIVLITSVLSFLTLVLGELAPKRIAMQRAEGWALLVARPLDVLSTLSRPLVWLLGRATNLVVRLTGADPDAGREEVTAEELRDMVAAQGSAGPPRSHTHRAGGNGRPGGFHRRGGGGHRPGDHPGPAASHEPGIGRRRRGDPGLRHLIATRRTVGDRACAREAVVRVR